MTDERFVNTMTSILWAGVTMEDPVPVGIEMGVDATAADATPGALHRAGNNALAEVAPLKVMAETLGRIKTEGGSKSLRAYVRNMRVPLLGQARRVVLEIPTEQH